MVPMDSCRHHYSHLSQTLCSAESVALRSQDRIQILLKTCARSEDEFVRTEAIRAQASLADLRLKSPKYAEGIYLLHPPPSSAGYVDSAFDVVLIHGVTGDPISTWRAGPENPDPKMCGPFTYLESSAPCRSYDGSFRERSWARDWLPVDFPDSRVISVGYEVSLPFLILKLNIFPAPFHLFQ